MNAEYHAAVEEWLHSLPLEFELDNSINPLGQVVYIRPRGAKLFISQSALDDNPLVKIIAVLSSQTRDFWLEDRELVLNSDLQLRTR